MTAVLQVVVPVVGLAVWQATRGGGGGGGDQAGASPGAPLMSTVIMTVGSAAISLAGLAFAGAALHPLWSSRHWTTATATVLQLAHRAVAKFPELTRRHQRFIGTVAARAHVCAAAGG